MAGRQGGWRRAGLIGVAVAGALALGACGIAEGQTTKDASAVSTTISDNASTGGGATTTAPPTTAAPTTSTRPTTSTAPTTTPTKPAKLGPGDTGAAVVALQKRLMALGYQVPSADGTIGSETDHAIVAFQKVNRLDRDGIAGPQTMKALENPRVPQPRMGGSGLHIEADLTLQVVYVVVDGKIQRILDASSASGQTYVVDGDTRIAHTPEGSFRIQRKINSWHRSDLGLLYRPAYFIGGYALHGAPSVPPFPASHGCIRITTTSMDALYDRLPVGTPMLVYRT
jgi:lipoprotein-anchoring transpeptidase ErfK/SrfK